MLMQKLKYMSNLTTQEQAIIDYILEKPELVFTCTAHELAQITYTSASTVVRLCKKLGFNGYPGFQLQLALEYHPQKPEEQTQDIAMAKGNSLPSIIEEVPYLYNQSLELTKASFDLAQLQRIAEWIQGAERVDIYGTNTNYYVAEETSAKWNEIGIHAFAHNNANLHYLLNNSKHKPTVSFLISNTGINASMIEAANILQSHGNKIVAVTSDGNSPLAALCDEVLLSYGYMQQMRLSKITSVISVKYIFDVLYMYVISQQQEE